MKGNKTWKICLIVLLAVVVVGFAMAHSNTLKATDEGDANYGETVATGIDETQEAPAGTTEYVSIPEETEPVEEAEPAEETEPAEEAEPVEEAEPAEEAPAEEAVEKSVEVVVGFVGGEFTGFGTEVELSAKLTGYEGETPSFQWQYSADEGETWKAVENANGQTYTFEITEENYTYSWRVEVQA